GTVSQDQANRALDAMGTKVTTARAVLAAMTGTTTDQTAAAGAMSKAHGVAADAANVATGAHAGFTRELVILGHEVVSGNFSRIPGSMMVLAERSGNLNAIMDTFKSVVFGWPGA